MPVCHNVCVGIAVMKYFHLRLVLHFSFAAFGLKHNSCPIFFHYCSVPVLASSAQGCNVVDVLQPVFKQSLSFCCYSVHDLQWY